MFEILIIASLFHLLFALSGYTWIRLAYYHENGIRYKAVPDKEFYIYILLPIVNIYFMCLVWWKFFPIEKL